MLFLPAASSAPATESNRAAMSAANRIRSAWWTGSDDPLSRDVSIGALLDQDKILPSLGKDLPKPGKSRIEVKRGEERSSPMPERH